MKSSLGIKTLWTCVEEILGQASQRSFCPPGFTASQHWEGWEPLPVFPPSGELFGPANHFSFDF